MVYGAIDLHMRYSQIRIVDSDGQIVRDQRVVTSPERLIAGFSGQGAMRILLETGTESEWSRRRWRPLGTRSSWLIRITRRCTASFGAR